MGIVLHISRTSPRLSIYLLSVFLWPPSISIALRPICHALLAATALAVPHHYSVTYNINSPYLGGNRGRRIHLAHLLPFPSSTIIIIIKPTLRYGRIPHYNSHTIYSQCQFALLASNWDRRRREANSWCRVLDGALHLSIYMTAAVAQRRRQRG